ncbi:DUF1549 domain-containing protein [Bythopirellula polymerisocia]|uniref:DUF1549 domain-containing protein n=1 Tax=Bythopirellula polymerisocia TaxID=2528003 RepID=A0A5C6D199_9BACT|nr:DUF1549 domain-containing protein [Bythopirellula polymerisocia]TWU29965.1 hypothetical protein Pla144_07460 [Bythopirellula polymerisocia]
MLRVDLFMLLLLLWAPLAKAESPGRLAKRIDQAIQNDVFDEETELAPRTDDYTFVRRAWLDVVGDIPSPEEVTSFVLDPAEDKRETLVARLLADPHFGQNWARYWRDVVFFRAVDERAEIAAGTMETDLTEWLNEGRPWSEIATEFITAHGDVRENGGTAIMMAQDGMTEETTAEVSRIFLGIQIQCAQCHDHPYDRWKREQFHELAAFFPRIAVRPVRDLTSRSFEVIGTDRFGRKPPKNERFPTAEHKMPDLEDPQAPGTQMEPKFFLTSAKVPWGTSDSARRLQLAQWLTENEWFATALVNRMWAELVGEGFYPSVDDIGPDRTTVAPTAVKLLSRKFKESGYDLKWLMKTICQTEAYQRESRPRRETDGTPFVANVPQRLRSDQLYNALLSAFNAPEENPPRGRRPQRPQAAPRGRFAEAFAYDPSINREEAVSSIPQVLALMNSMDVNLLFRGKKGSVLPELIREIKQDEELTTELFLRCLGRVPTSEELEIVKALRQEGMKREVAFEDLAWSLVNSAEFQHRR